MLNPPNLAFTPSNLPTDPETKEGYELWHSLILKFSQASKFMYESLGETPAPKNNRDIHLTGRFPHLEGKNHFGETTHAHLQRWYLLGEPCTDYELADGFLGGLHTNGFEYPIIWGSGISAFSNVDEFAPLLCPADQNFYMESANKTITQNPTYDTRPTYPILHPLHEPVFSPSYVRQILHLPADSLEMDFTLGLDPNNRPTEDIRILHFALSLLYSSMLYLSAFKDIFGPSLKKTDMIRTLHQNWDPSTGHLATTMSAYHRHLLNFFMSSSHQMAFISCYGIFRNKYKMYTHGQYGSFYYGRGADRKSFKNQLYTSLKNYITALEIHRHDIPENTLNTQLNHCRILGSLFGIGYYTQWVKGKNYHSYGSVRLSTFFNLTCRANVNSPLWQLWYRYAGVYFNFPQYHRAVLKGRGRYWRRIKHSPNVRLIYLFHQYSKQFWLGCLEGQKAEKLIKYIKKNT